MAWMGTLLLFLILEEKLSALPLFNMMLAQGLLYITFIMCNYIPSVDYLLNLYYERLSNIGRYFFVSIETWFLSFILVMYHIYCYAHVESFLHSSDESYLVMVYDLFNVVLNLVYYYTVKNFGICIYQGYWPVVLFSCSVLIWLLYQLCDSIWYFFAIFFKSLLNFSLCWCIALLTSVGIFMTVISNYQANYLILLRFVSGHVSCFLFGT